MKAVICEASDGKDLMRDLAYESIAGNTLSRHSAVNLRERLSLTEDDIKWIVQEIHGTFVYRVTGWLQKHGFETTN